MATSKRVFDLMIKSEYNFRVGNIQRGEELYIMAHKIKRMEEEYDVKLGERLACEVGDSGVQPREDG